MFLERRFGSFFPCPLRACGKGRLGGAVPSGYKCSGQIGIPRTALVLSLQDNKRRYTMDAPALLPTKRKIFGHRTPIRGPKIVWGGSIFKLQDQWAQRAHWKRYAAMVSISSLALTMEGLLPRTASRCSLASASRPSDIRQPASVTRTASPSVVVSMAFSR